MRALRARRKHARSRRKLIEDLYPGDPEKGERRGAASSGTWLGPPLIRACVLHASLFCLRARARLRVRPRCGRLQARRRTEVLTIRLHSPSTCAALSPRALKRARYGGDAKSPTPPATGTVARKHRRRPHVTQVYYRTRFYAIDVHHACKVRLYPVKIS